MRGSLGLDRILATVRGYFAGATTRSETSSVGDDGKPAVTIGAVRILAIEPPVFLTGIPYDDHLGIARAFGEAFGNRPAGFIVYPTWSLERKNFPEAVLTTYLAHREKYPDHRFHFICNTRLEEALLAAVGLPSTFLNKNFTVSETIFRPLPAEAVEFDAIYNARFVAVKRHDLVAEVPRVAFLAYVDGAPGSREEFDRLSQAALGRNPQHRLLNELENGIPRTLAPASVNKCMARASVGLILSPVEGSSYASMEYMLAGMPVVSTPSTGGRDVYFDDEYCIVCEPEARAVRDAVEELKKRNLPRDYIRRRTLEKIEPERMRLLALADDMREQLGARRLNRTRWPFSDISGVPWKKNSVHLSAWTELRDRAALAAELGLGEEAMDEVQLTPAEIRPIVAAIRERPGCRLLVFGCGHDSFLWSTANRDGTTVFLEDQTEWAALARSRLSSATVIDVSYTTQLADWPQLLERNTLQQMALPHEVAAARWDVVLVDAPGGYADDQPGRMQSIEAASRLVKPGGIVFVHDCERPAEAASAARFLARAEVVVEAKGRALLRGYRVPDTAV